MTEYALYLESGPKRRKTMVHVLDLLGCVAVGPTTEAAVDATPDEIRAYLRLLKRAGENVDPKGPFKTRVAEHITNNAIFIGRGSSYITFGPDLRPVTPLEIDTFVKRFQRMREELARWVKPLTAKQLDTPNEGGRPARKVILHMMNASAYLTTILGTQRGMSSLAHAAELGDVPLEDALRRVDVYVATSLRAATPEQRRAIVQRPDHVRTMRKAIRRMLEHDWEHRAELSRRPNGPKP